MTYTTETTLIITTDDISAKTVKSIVNGMGYERVVKFVQDGDCGWVRLRDFDGSAKWAYIATTKAAKLMTGHAV